MYATYLLLSRALDSLREGKRMMETKYAMIRHEKQASMYEILMDNGSQKQDNVCGVLDAV